jgi:cytoskeleton protein RodZ
MTRQEEQLAEQSPGAALKKARESAGLSIEQVAEKLFLLESVVSSLEKDCYDRIRGETFVRGYMRNYARLLGLDDQEILGRYAARRRASAPAKSDSRFGRRRDGMGGSTGAGRIGVVLLLLGLSVAFVFYNRPPVAESYAVPVQAVTVETQSGTRIVPLLPEASGSGLPAARLD